METERRQQHEGLWDVDDVARYLKCSVAMVRARVLNETIPFRKVGRLVRFEPSAIAEWVRTGGMAEVVQDATQNAADALEVGHASTLPAAAAAVPHLSGEKVR